VTGIGRWIIDGIRRVKINRSFQGGDALPEDRILVQIEILAVGLAIDHGSLELEIMHATFEFVGRFDGIVHGQMGESTVSTGKFLNLPGQKIIRRL
jgi:hypothetical protein